ncbi:MAG: hypothetical protein IJ533_09735 [Prevotella sp.]|nr:hypothetical protein [Prevotella sp.]
MMKRLLLSMAAVLLTCISASAQSGVTLKGDVNGDGRVDITDVTTTIDLILDGKDYGYFYFGTTEPTASNFQSLPGVVASYTSLSDAAGATTKVSDGETLYLLCPAAWLAGKTVELEDESGNSIDFLEEKDNVTISGYVIYRTSVLNGKKIVGLKKERLQEMT